MTYHLLTSASKILVCHPLLEKDEFNLIVQNKKKNKQFSLKIVFLCILWLAYLSQFDNLKYYTLFNDKLIRSIYLFRDLVH